MHCVIVSKSQTIRVEFLLVVLVNGVICNNFHLVYTIRHLLYLQQKYDLQILLLYNMYLYRGHGQRNYVLRFSLPVFAKTPHLHFQIMLSMMDFKIDFPGVMYFNQINIWKEICPDPNLFFKSKSLDSKQEISSHELINFRKKHLGESLKLHYNDPIRIVRGAGQYLMDNTGRLYLDTVNNVAHVGHENPFIVTAGQKQMAVLNANTRYLHESIKDSIIIGQIILLGLK